MDKSMVMELAGMAQSNVFKPRQSVISTQYSDLEGGMRKSRIHNYPGYKREDLSGKLNFVVVFQTIEIERLSWEIEKQRVNILDLSRQHANCYNYEVQIRELTERIHFLECERENFQDRCAEKDQFAQRIFMEYENYKAAHGQDSTRTLEAERKRNHELQTEAEMWRLRCASLAKDIEAAKRDTSSRESRTIRELTSRHEQENKNLRAEAERLRMEVDRRAQQMEDFEELVGLLHVRDAEILEIRQQMEDYENKCAMISQENYRLSELIQQRDADIAKYRDSEAQFDLKLQQAEKQMSKTNDQLANTKQNNHGLAELERQNSQYKAQVEALSKQLETVSAETEQQRKRATILQTKINSINNATQREFANYEDRVIGYMRQQEQLKSQLNAKLEENQRLQQRTADIEQVCLRIKTVEDQNEALKQELAVCAKTIEDYTRRLKRTEKQQDKISTLSEQLEAARQKNKDLQAETTKFTQIQSELSTYYSTMGTMSQQLARINGQLQLRSSELAQLRQSLKDQAGQSQSVKLEQMLSQSMQQMEQMLLRQDDLRQQNETLQNGNMILEFALKKIETHNMALTNQKDQLQQQLATRLEETQQMQAQLAALAGKVGEMREMQVKVAETQKQLEGLRCSHDQMESKYKSECQKSHQFSMQVEQLSTQIMQLRSAPRMNEQMSQQLSVIRCQSQKKDQIIADLRIRIERIEKILRILSQKYELTISFATTLHQSIESCSNKMEFFTTLASALQKYGQPSQNYELPAVEMCESMRVLQEVNPTRNVELTFKEESKTHSYINETRPYSYINDNRPYSYISEGRPPSFPTERYSQQDRIQTETALVDQFDRIEERQGSEGTDGNALSDRREGSSLSGSLINTLITKESSARFQNSRVQYEPQPSFGHNISASNLRYIPISQSPSSARFGNLMIDTQMEHSNVRLLPSPPNVISPIHEAGFSGLPRVTSHTVFAPMRMGPSSEDAPRVRIMQPFFNPSRNTASFTRTISRVGPCPSMGEGVRLGP